MGKMFSNEYVAAEGDRGGGVSSRQRSLLAWRATCVEDLRVPRGIQNGTQCSGDVGRGAP